MGNDWKVICEPQGRNDGTNDGGIVIYATQGGSIKQEVTRVAYVRRNSKNPDTPFEQQLGAEIDRARTAVSVLNEQLAGAGELH